jgi:hypothetical protein
MLLGRLEIIALMVVVFPGTWIGHRQTPPDSEQGEADQ